MSHESAVHLETDEPPLTFLAFGFLSHAGPYIRVNDISAFHSL